MTPSRKPTALWAISILLAGATAVAGCEGIASSGSAPASSPGSEEERAASDIARAEAAAAEAEAARQAEIDREFPWHAVVTGAQLAVRATPDPRGDVIGWLRLGARVRVKEEATPTSRCATGWHAVHPEGYACAGLGMELGAEPPEDPNEELAAADATAALPYEYLKVKEDLVPEYHRLPTREEHAEAMAWAARYLELREDNPERAARMRRGELRGQEPPRRVARYLDKGVIIANVGIERREQRRFARTVGSRYVLRVQLNRKNGSDFQGVDIDDQHRLPIPWARRDLRPRLRVPDERPPERRQGQWRFLRDDEAEVIPRMTIVPGWQRRERFDADIMHVLDGERYARSWYIGVAEAIEPPFEVEEDEPWVHVDLGEQLLMLYRGATPIFSTLISSGDANHETPTGIFRIQRKMITSTMSNLGGNAGGSAGDRYRIEDVPYTQYFDGGIALHAAFWHERFGVQVSHGCVNLSPADAQRVFDHTWPRIPDGWHGVVTHDTSFRASKVWVTRHRARTD